MLPQAPLFQFHHGDHICVFYRTETALLEILTPYVAEGLRKNERCFCVQSNEVIRRLTLDLQFIGVNVEREISRGALQFYTENEIYFEGGSFDGEGMIRRLMRSIEAAVKDGGFELDLVTHDAGGITGKDFELAAAMDRFAASL